MSEHTNVVDFAAPQPSKRVEGSRKNAKWVLWYDRKRKEWCWHLTITLEPQTFGGYAATELEVTQAMHAMLKACGI